MVTQLSADSAIAGYIAGVSSLLIGHPLESIKVAIQNSQTSISRGMEVAGVQAIPQSTQQTSAKGVRNHSIGAQKRGYAELAFNFGPRRTMETSTLKLLNAPPLPNGRSILNLYSGVVAPLVTVGFVQSLSFFLYENIRTTLRTSSVNSCRNEDSLFHIWTAAAAAGGLVSFITSPLALLKTKQQMMMWSAKEALKDTLSIPSKHAGASKWRNFYAGFQSHFLCDSLGRAIFFTSYEFLKRSCQRFRKINFSGGEYISICDRMISACVAGMISSGVLYPVDVLRSKMFCHSALFHSAPPSEFEMAKAIYTKEGVRPFFRGIQIAVVRSGPIAAVALPVYDLSLEYLKSDN